MGTLAATPLFRNWNAMVSVSLTTPYIPAPLLEGAIEPSYVSRISSRSVIMCVPATDRNRNTDQGGRRVLNPGVIACSREYRFGHSVAGLSRLPAVGYDARERPSSVGAVPWPAHPPGVVA